jgi:hemoglobin
MKGLALIAFVLSCLLTQSCTYNNAPPSLHDDIGGNETLNKIFGLAISRIYNDPVLAPHFKGIPKQYIRKKLVLQTCELIGGPCVYDGKSMHEAHIERNVTELEFYRLVEHVQFAMRRIGLSYEHENYILQKLAPLKSSIIYQMSDTK